MRRRWDLQAAAAHLLPSRKSLMGCQRWAVCGGEEVQFVHYPVLQKARFGGVQSCKSPWVCPVCAAKISERRVRMDLQPALIAAKAQGLHVLMVTWTLRHSDADELRALLNGLRLARKHSRSGKVWDKMRCRHGIVGSIRALEVTHGVNGWHPHLHELIFCERPIDRAALLADLAHRWDLGIAKAGLKKVNEHGVRMSDAHEFIEKYLQKTGQEPRWGLAQEMGKQQVKKARAEKGRSAFQLLGQFADSGDMDAGALFQEYADAVRSWDQLFWSKGLKARLGVADLTDQQIADLDEQDQSARVMDTLAVPEWNCLLADGKRADAWELTAKGDDDALAALLAPYKGIRQTGRVATLFTPVLDDPFADERDRLPVVGVWQDPLAAEVAQTPARGVDLARRLRERNGRGESVYHFDRLREQQAARQAETPEIARPGSFLGPVVKRHGGRGVLRLLALASVLAGDVDWSDDSPAAACPEGLQHSLALDTEGR